MKKLITIMSFVLLSACSTQRVVLTGKGKVSPTKVRFERGLDFDLTVTPVQTDQSVGIARTGVQYTETPIFIQNPEVLKALLKKSLESHQVIINNSSENKLKVGIGHLWLTEVLKNNEAAKCEIKMNFRVVKDQATIDSDVAVEYQTAGDLQDATEKIEDAFSTCVDIAVIQFLKDKKLQTLR